MNPKHTFFFSTAVSRRTLSSCTAGSCIQPCGLLVGGGDVGVGLLVCWSVVLVVLLSFVRSCCFVAVVVLVHALAAYVVAVVVTVVVVFVG
jgi:hypothetical protein